MKKLIHQLTDLTFTSSENKATLHAKGETSTPGWTGPELGNPRIGDGILHLDFVAEPPRDATTEVLTPISAKHTLPLGPQPQDVTVHSATNELSVRLPAIGDPA